MNKLTLDGNLDQPMIAIGHASPNSTTGTFSSCSHQNFSIFDIHFHLSQEERKNINYFP